ncbi:hypothetical protein AGMMS49928_24610 [Spirochaetia bacterium]|nr:hypothetical protein AGMMS49928_24610 [Spirochaetia bacterium]
MPLLLLGGADFLFGIEFQLRDAEGNPNRFFPLFSTLNIGGELSLNTLFYPGDFTDSQSGDQNFFETFYEKNKLWDIVSGKFRFSLLGPQADGVVNLDFAPVYDGSSFPITIDEVYIRLYFWDLEVEGGFRKLTWGKTGSGPLDLVNPLDYSDFTMSIIDPAGRKIPRLLLHLTWDPGGFGKLQGVFVPSFQGHRYQYTVPDDLNTDRIEYFQAGLRYTAEFDTLSFGAQYFYGNFFWPTRVNIDYNRYHQIGLDASKELWGFTLHSEAALFLTYDMAGDRGDIYNPFISWSLGFDRDLVWGIKADLGAAGTIRPLQSRVENDPLVDTEAGENASSTRMTLLLSKKIFDEMLEFKAQIFWGIEDKDFFIGPAVLFYPLEPLTLELSGGIFGGDESGGLGQYHRNGFVKFRFTFAI